MFVFFQVRGEVPECVRKKAFVLFDWNNFMVLWCLYKGAGFYKPYRKGIVFICIVKILWLKN